MDILKEVSRPLSGQDILDSFVKKPNIIKYSDIHKYDNISQILGKNKMCVLLYLTNKNYGHWCCIYEHNGTIFFFDSYGLIPDDELNFIPMDLRKELKQEHRLLTKMLYDNHKPVEYNEYKLQDKAKKISTCGRWVIVRLQYKHISVEDFADIFLEHENIVSPDVLVTYLTLSA